MAFAIVATIGGALIGADAAGDAADSQSASSAAATAEQRRQFDITQENYRPYLDAGRTALGQLHTENDTPFDASSVMMDPGYEFARRQGQQAIDRQAAASGGRISGAALKAASEYNTGMAQQGYSTAYNRQNQARTDRLNRLAALAGVGQTSTQQISAAGQGTANAISNIATAQGDASAAARLAQGNIWGSATNQLAAIYGDRQARNT